MSETKIYDLEAKEPATYRRRTVLIFGGTSLVLFFILSGTTYALAKSYEERILPHVSVAGINVSGLDRLAASEVLQAKFIAMIESGLTAELFSETQHLALQPTGATDPDLVYQLADWDISKSVDYALGIGRNQGKLTSYLSPLYYATIGQVNIRPVIVLAETRLMDAIREAFPEAESPGAPTDFVFTETNGELTVSINPAQEGAILDMSHALATIRQDAEDLDLQTLQLRLVERTLGITADEAQTLIPQAIAAVEGAPYRLIFTDEYNTETSYEVSADNLKTWLLPGRDEFDQPAITLDVVAMDQFLTRIHDKIDVRPQNAVFVVEGDRVIQFSESRDGFIINDDTLLKDLTRSIGTEDKDIAIAAERTPPEVSTADANDLGIKEILGVGTSNFAGSPSNRRANIRHGASKLNGVLIPPGETLSLLEKLRPFTTADGYLPELVIKGDEIIPEIGGGLCQIGTTTFRASMNSGLDIIERRNHSLVVSYYNDPANGNPGTDATIYDPSPDFKVKNDTPAHIMLVTEVDEAKSELRFTYWGTSDGREGSYTPPVVLSWTGYGTPIEKETDSLAPGERKCQSPHPGATTTFDYTISRADGSSETESFFSSYRSLPTVCLVGISETVASTNDDLLVDLAQ